MKLSSAARVWPFLVSGITWRHVQALCLQPRTTDTVLAKLRQNSMLSAASSTSDNPENQEPIPRKAHYVTVAMIPPPENALHVWKVVTEMRKQLKDPGFYRWPPHANLLYPFLNVSLKEEDKAKVDEMLAQLHSATRQIEPFPVVLQGLETFGGKQRGVLWLKPDQISDTDASLNQLHKKLEEAFPKCKDQTKGKSFTPHMTLSHFANLDEAIAAKDTIEMDYQQALSGQTLSFLVDRIYLMHRKGDEGQFLRLAEIGLGADSKVQPFQPPQPFDEMPLEEEEWVYEERMKVKARKSSGKKRGGQRKQRRRSTVSSRVPDTPLEIAAKRAARAAKRDLLEQEQQRQGHKS